MKRALRINYARLQAVVDDINDYIQSCEQMRCAIINIDGLIALSQGDAVEALRSSKQKVLDDLTAHQEYLVNLRNLTDAYIRDMTAISAPLAWASMTRADTNDIYWNIQQMGWYTHIFAANTYQVYVDPTDSAAVAFEAQIQQKMNSLNSEISYVCAQIADTIDALWQVQHRLVDYENTDDTYASEASSLYKSRIGWFDWAHETSMYYHATLMSSMLSETGDIISGVGGLLMYANSEIGCLICSPFGGAPDFLVNYRDSYRQGFVTFINDPGAAISTMLQDFLDEVDEDPIYAFGRLIPDIAFMVFGTKGLEKVVKGVEATRSLEGIDELGAGGKVAKGVEGADGAGSVGSRLAIIDGKVGGKIPLKEYQELRLSSVMNPDSDTLTLGKYANDTSSYTVRAGDTEYFDMGSDWDRVRTEYGLSISEMFDFFNKPVLDDAIASGQRIRFSHDPRLYDKGFLVDEWEYLKSTLGLADDDLVFEGGFWIVD